MTGEVLFIAIVVNSREIQILLIDWAIYLPLGGSPKFPTNNGITTVKPAATTSLAKFSTAGVMPGIS